MLFEPLAGLLIGQNAIYFIAKLAEPNKAHHDEQRNQNTSRPSNVAKEARHLHAAIFHDGFDHQVGRIADVRVRAHEHRACGNRGKRGGIRRHQSLRIAAREVEKDEVSRCVIQERTEHASGPKVRQRAG